MAGQDNCAERGEAQEDEAEDGVNEAEEGRADAVGEEDNDADSSTKRFAKSDRTGQKMDSDRLGGPRRRQ